VVQYTNDGLVKHAEKALGLKTRYMWGGILREITPAYIDQLRNIYGNQSGTGYTAERWNSLLKVANKGVYGVDCVGLVKSYYWSGKKDGGVGSPKYDGATDCNATAMYNKATVKGKIDTLPERPGVIVFCKSHPHVGIYVGNGYTIESTLGSRGDGVVKRKLDGLWEYWFECPFIEYKTSALSTAKTKKCVLAFPAAVRSEPRTSAEKLGELKPGNTVTVVVGSEKKDPKSGYVYIKLYGEGSRWIVKTSIKA
jgi:cell wall-associated NlpC family hydrolase